MAYAAVVSLAQILKQLLQSDHLPLHYPKLQLQSLHENISCLQSSLADISHVPKMYTNAVDDLEIKIRDAIYRAQDTIEFFVSRQILAPETEENPADQSTSASLFMQDLQEIMANIGPINKAIDEIAHSIRKPTGDSPSTSEDTPSGKSSFSTKIKIVGQDEDRNLVMAQLKSDTNERQIVPIIGMPGIGKTTLVRSIYEHQDMENHFILRAWVTVSSISNVRDIFLKLHASMVRRGKRSDDSGSMKNIGNIVNQEGADLALQLYQKLYDTRYLVVIDDMWDTRVWNEINRTLPDKKNGSRIVITTRNGMVADYIVKPPEFRRVMQPLGPEDSWTLLCGKVYEEGDSKAQYPPSLEKIGRSIANNCQGLPLSLTVVGGLLSQKRTEEYWKFVEEDTKAALAKSEDNYSEILSLSYRMLPGRLKGCFLYMGAFPKDSEVSVSKLIKLWVAEGFLTPPSGHESLEQVAGRYLKDLNDRNLIFVHKISSDGQIKSCGLHNTMWDLAVKESQKQKFFHAIDRYVQEPSEDRDTQRRLSVHKNALIYTKRMYNSTKSIKVARTLLCVGLHHHQPQPFSLTFELLRVLDAYSLYFIEFPTQIIKLVHLRYLSFTYNGRLPSSISKLQNLQILIVRRHPRIIFTGTSILPVEIWNMGQLRHLLFTESELPSITFDAQNSVLLENLQSLSNVNAASCTKKVLQNIPNLKKLGIWIESPSAVSFHFDALKNLEAFKFTVLHPDPEAEIEFLPELAFPKNLRKLSLRGCGIPWKDMAVIAELPHLQVLKLRELAFKGEYWILDGMRFRDLEFLLLEYMDLKYWGADNYDEARCFPSLKRLIIRHCYELKEIPEDIGNIGGIKLIELVDCSPSAMKSAEDIRDQQKDYKEDFQVRIYSS